MLNHPYEILTLDEALSTVEAVFARFARDDQVFIRPCGVQKTFTGRCVNREAFVGALGSARYAKGAVLMASPRRIGQEWRVVVARGRVVAASRYRSEGRLDVAPGCPPEVWAYVDALLADVPYRPDPIFMMDVCASGSDLYLLELNSFSCSGLYRCEPATVVAEVKQLAIEAWEKAMAGSEWPSRTEG
jgi:hypothetical protein